MQFKMKDVCLVGFFFLLLLFSQHAYSQTSTFGIKVGLQGAFLGGDAKNMRAGFHAGVFFIEPIENLSLQPEVYYSLQGAGFNDSDDELRLHYLQLPILFRSEKEKHFLVFGPSFGVAIGARLKLDSDYRNNPELFSIAQPREERANVITQVSNFDCGLVFGLGFKLGDGAAAEFRINWGLSDALDIPKSEVLSYPNRLLQFTISQVLKNE